MRLTTTFSALFFTITITACSDSGPAQTSPTGPTVTPNYLAGPWCLTHTDYNGEIEAENVNYRFGADGSLAVQTSTMNDALKEGFRWSVQGSELKMTHLPGTSTILSVEPDAMVLKYFIEQHFARGACA